MSWFHHFANVSLPDVFVSLQGNTVAAMGSFRALRRLRIIVEHCFLNGMRPSDVLKTMDAGSFFFFFWKMFCSYLFECFRLSLQENVARIGLLKRRIHVIVLSLSLSFFFANVALFFFNLFLPPSLSLQLQTLLGTYQALTLFGKICFLCMIGFKRWKHTGV